MTTTADRTTSAVDPIRAAAFQSGCPVVVVDDTAENGRTMLAFAAARATTSTVAFTIRHTSGFLTTALPAERCRILGLPPMVGRAPESGCSGSVFTVAVDAAHGIGTGISALDRAVTIGRLADDSYGHEDFVRPGHVLVVCLSEDGSSGYPYARELASFARVLGLAEAAAFADLVSPEDETRLATRSEAHRFADEHGLEIVSVQAISSFVDYCTGV
ncbi:3,4-dihydroxy-2-butanone-4-phosphate synthase [Rhodococcus sp. Z13]|uniref:3,4-dihydroxy-2-butanone-4-phosphate synthase n=1 Tax=Rhodococcus sacchari TaxID=2962047 RepID=A0ACD4DHH4_9NOCA|nr:3,4-dihydroxy-2-butanone-4-phosphate synthase [Rhodococcus sp. Z13]UYP19545.1 3,4-dihydroxy-2-butanone-4-phosphate synthase [Rhodococcus sp. Z13]